MVLLLSMVIALLPCCFCDSRRLMLVSFVAWMFSVAAVAGNVANNDAVAVVVDVVAVVVVAVVAVVVAVAVVVVVVV